MEAEPDSPSGTSRSASETCWVPYGGGAPEFERSCEEMCAMQPDDDGIRPDDEWARSDSVYELRFRIPSFAGRKSSAQELVERVTFQPGHIGLNVCDSTGEVHGVDEGGQADDAGVQAGWMFVQIDGLPYSKELLDD